MECLICGSDNQEDSQFCRRCGTSLIGSETQVASSASHEVEAKEQEAPNLVTIPEDAVVVRQSQWAYVMPTIPFMVLLGVALFFDFFTFGIFPILATIYIVGSRYMSFHRTAYILTEEHLVIFQGSFFGRNRIDLPFANLDNIVVQPGMFGRSLGYTGVRLELVNQQIVFLQYVPLTSTLLEHLRVRMNPDQLP